MPAAVGLDNEGGGRSKRGSKNGEIGLIAATELRPTAQCSLGGVAAANDFVLACFWPRELIEMGPAMANSTAMSTKRGLPQPT